MPTKQELEARPLAALALACKTVADDPLLGFSVCEQGGWFDRKGVAPQRVNVNGCTWGGSALKSELVAARGMRLEFGNCVLTTPIEEVRLIRPLWRSSAAWASGSVAPLNHPMKG